MSKKTPIENYLDHLDNIFAVEPEFNIFDSINPELSGVTCIIYKNIPEKGMITGVTYGLSLEKHNEWLENNVGPWIQVRNLDNVMRKAERSIWVTFSKEGVHMYPGADTDPKLATGDWDDVSFLGIPHRHIFHFRVRIEVFHNDRDIEFIQFKRWMQRLYDVEGVLELNHKSCEMIADDLYKEISTKYPNRFVEISVAEDNENGCSIFYPTK